jgi:microcystin-dependent protein
MFAGNFPPSGWAFCNGQLFPISEYETLFNLIGTTYGGDGQSTFAVPNLQGRIAVHQGSGFTLGEIGGSELVTLTVPQMPGHTHSVQAQSREGTQSSPDKGVCATSPLNFYSTNVPTASMNSAAIGAAGSSQPHDNMMPYLTVTFIIALSGIFPSQQ